MPTFTMTKTWDTGQILTEADLDGIKDSTESFLNVTKLGSDNIKDAGVAATNIATNAVTTAKIIDSAVTTGKLADASVTAAKLATDAITTAKIADGAVTTAKLADGSVTAAKLGALGEQVSSSTGAFTGSATSATDVTNATVTVDVTDRGVLLFLQPAAATSGLGYIGANRGSTTSATDIFLLRGGSAIANFYFQLTVGGATSVNPRIPPSSVFYFDDPGAGTYTYKIQYAANSGSDTISFNGAKLVAIPV